MAKPATGWEKDRAAGQPAGDASSAPLNPLLAQSAAAMAAATAVGFSMASQFAGAFFGVLQGAMEASNRASRPAETKPAQRPETPAATVQPVKKRPGRKKAAADTTDARPSAGGKAPVRRTPAARAPASRATAAKGKAAAKTAAAGTTDLKLISGIGPKLETMLNRAGVDRIAQIAAWSDEDVTRFDETLGLDGRIGRDDWVGQARKLAE